MVTYAYFCDAFSLSVVIKQEIILKQTESKSKIIRKIFISNYAFDYIYKLKIKNYKCYL